MMRENESDGDGGWSQPHEYVRPWAPRDEGEDAGTRSPEADATPRSENGQDTIAFGMPSTSSGPDGQGSYVQPGYGSQPGGQAWYGSQDGYGQGGYGQGDSGDPAGHQAGGGYGAPGWARSDLP